MEHISELNNETCAQNERNIKVPLNFQEHPRIEQMSDDTRFAEQLGYSYAKSLMDDKSFPIGMPHETGQHINIGEHV